MVSEDALLNDPLGGMDGGSQFDGHDAAIQEESLMYDELAAAGRTLEQAGAGAQASCSHLPLKRGSAPQSSCGLDEGMGLSSQPCPPVESVGRAFSQVPDADRGIRPSPEADVAATQMGGSSDVEDEAAAGGCA